MSFDTRHHIGFISEVTKVELCFRHAVIRAISGEEINLVISDHDEAYEDNSCIDCIGAEDSKEEFARQSLLNEINKLRSENIDLESELRKVPAKIAVVEAKYKELFSTVTKFIKMNEVASVAKEKYVDNMVKDFISKNDRPPSELYIQAHRNMYDRLKEMIDGKSHEEI